MRFIEEITRLRHLTISICLLIVVMSIGVLGYRLVGGADWTFLDALYMTITTITTVGFTEVHELNTAGRIFTIGIIIAGVGTAFYVIGSVTQIVVEGQINNLIGRRRLEKQIEALKDHYIVCGCGRMGSIICRELKARPVPFVVIEKDEEAIQKVEPEGFLYILGDATDEGTLRRAGIERAKGIICVLRSDADNVYVVLTARELNRDIYILARAGEEGSEKKLLSAGADKVISPFHIGAMRMAHAILRPAVWDFIEMTTLDKTMDLAIEEIKICEGCRFEGETLRESNIRRYFDAIIIAIKKPQGEMIFNPDPDYRMTRGDVLITLGKRSDLARMARMLKA